LVLFDVDHFKAVNDTYGHVAGDVVLRDLAAMCRKLLRPVDLISRIGGEEFAAILPETNYSSGLACSERLRCEIAAMRFPDFPTLAVTASFGISSSEMGTAESWMSSADECLYAAKRSGRNRCVVSALERLAS
jgi:diguanylate cyclase (GGDEF)-like protein